MAAIRERVKRDGTKTFHAQVRMAGFPSRTATFRSRRAAERWGKKTEADMIEGRHFRNVEARRRTLADAVDRYLREQLPKKRDQSMPKARLLWWKAQLGKTKLADISPALIVEHRDKLAAGTYQRARPDSRRSTVKEGDRPAQFKRSPATVNRYLASLGHLFTVARREWHWLGHNPMDGVSRLPENRGRIRALTDEERRGLLEQTAKDPTLHTFVMIALTTACRAGELGKLTWADVDLREGRLLFRETKNAQPRSTWMHGETLRLLKAHGKVRRLQGGLVFTSDKGKPYRYREAFEAAVEAAGIADFRFHDLRHTAATMLARQGATEQQLRAIGGWKSAVVNRYVHLAGEDAKRALKQLSAKIEQ